MKNSHNTRALDWIRTREHSVCPAYDGKPLMAPSFFLHMNNSSVEYIKYIVVGLQSSPEDGDCLFLRNVGIYLQVPTRRYNLKDQHRHLYRRQNLRSCRYNLTKVTRTLNPESQACMYVYIYIFGVSEELTFGRNS
jgi:hypothetical protein